MNSGTGAPHHHYSCLWRTFPNIILSHVKEIPGLLTLSFVFFPKVTLGTNRKMEGGCQELSKAVFSKGATMEVHSLGSGHQPLQAKGCPPSISDGRWTLISLSPRAELMVEQIWEGIPETADERNGLQVLQVLLPRIKIIIVASILLSTPTMLCLMHSSFCMLITL